jgi:hypothetical protein
MIYRGDVKEGEPISERNVYVPDLAKGYLGFDQSINQNKDVKAFAGDVPPATLAAGKAVVVFPQQPEETIPVDLTPYLDKTTSIITASTGQLQWHYGSDKGYILINTPGTKGLVGFGAGKMHDLSQVSLTVETPFAVVLLTSLEPHQTIAQARRLLLTTVARARNSGMQYAHDKPELIAVGGEPLVLEPVKATFRLPTMRTGRLHVLDHAGRRTGKSYPFKNYTVIVDGTRHQTLYYEIEAR